jgi:ferrous iron transport protein B
MQGNSMKNRFTIALVGQPNVGKTQLLNALSGSNLRVGNFAGVTVEKFEATIIQDGITFDFIDLPGLYNLDDFAKDETVTKEYLLNEKYDLILNVVDSTNFERNLYLSSELMSLNKKMLMVLNMDDEAIKEGIEIDEKALSTLLNIPCIKVSSTKKTNLDVLMTKISSFCKSFYESKYHLFFEL